MGGGNSEITHFMRSDEGGKVNKTNKTATHHDYAVRLKNRREERQMQTSRNVLIFNLHSPIFTLHFDLKATACTLKAFDDSKLLWRS